MDGTEFLFEFLFELDPCSTKRMERLYVQYVLPKYKEII